jgi:hypothetical protein
MSAPLQIGDWVQSAPDSGDVLSMKMLWEARIVGIRPAQGSPDGLCYETLGWWNTESRKKDARLRQLWVNHLVLKP